MFPVIDTEQILASQDELGPIPWTYKFDWEMRQFKKGSDGRYLKTKTYAEYLEEISKKIINTRRFQYPIYSGQVGVEYFDYRGMLPKQVSLNVIKADVEDALQAHIEIEKATVIDIRFEGNKVLYSFEVIGIRGNTRVVIDVWRR